MADIELEGSRILVVEDEPSLLAGLRFNLEAEGYSVVCEENGRDALERCNEEEFDLVIMDVMIPYVDGFAVTEALRDKSPRLPILILTARTDLADRVRGLELGADDYMTKPFHLPELLLRVKGILRRKRWYAEALSGNARYSFSDVSIDFDDLTYQAGERSARLTPQEAVLMRYFLDNEGRIIPRQELLEKVWHVDGLVETRTVDSFILRLRKHFEPDPGNPVHILSVRGAGYRFVG